MRSYARLIMLVGGAVSALFLVASYLFFTGFGNHLLKQSAVRQADTIAQLTFSSMYQLMSKGWTREQVVIFADHSASSLANTPTRIEFFRAEPVSRQFGEVANPKRDADLDAALASGRVRQVDHDGGLTYHMPLVAQADCLRCHGQARAGEVMGVISVHNDFSKELKETSMHMFLVLLLLSPLPFIAALIVAVHLDHRFEDFSHALDREVQARQSGQPVDLGRVQTRYHEFQDILDRIRKLLG